MQSSNSLLAEQDFFVGKREGQQALCDAQKRVRKLLDHYVGF